MPRAVRRLRGLRRNAAVAAFTVIMAGAGSTLFASPAHAENVEFGYAGGPQDFVVPPGVTEIEVSAHGAAGGLWGGRGSMVTVRLPVLSGERLLVYVGGNGGEAGEAGFNGGGFGGGFGHFTNLAGGGGGATDVRRGAGTLADRVVVAGGGGGGTYGAFGGGGDQPGGPSWSGAMPGDAGIGPYAQGRRGSATGAGGFGVLNADLLTPCAPGQPGTVGTGGAGSHNCGLSETAGGGGGGGGYSGGGGGGSARGSFSYQADPAGGSSYPDLSEIEAMVNSGGDGDCDGYCPYGAGGGGGSSYADPTATHVSVSPGYASYGYVAIGYSPLAPSAPLLPTAVPGPDAGQITLAWAPPTRLGDATTVSSYRVYRYTPATGWQLAGSTSDPTFTDSSRDPTITYTYRVTAVNSYGEGPGSAEVSASAYAIADGPYTTVTPNHDGDVDKTYYKVGLRVRHGSQTYGEVREGVIEGPLPVTTPAYPYDVTPGADADGDGVPGTLVLHYRTTRITESGGTVHTLVGTSPVPLDPDDGDATTPKPQPAEGPYATVTPNYGGQADRVYYKVGLRVVFAGQTYGSVQEDVLDGPLPATTPAYTYDVSLGADADGDGVPATVVLHNRTTSVTSTGATSHTSTGTTTVAADPDDADDTSPRPKVVDGPYAQATPAYDGDTYATRYKVGAMVRFGGQDYGRILEGTVAPFHDVDSDFVPDEAEAALCANQNSNFNADGTCIGSDYSPPTVEGILADLDWLSGARDSQESET